MMHPTFTRRLPLWLAITLASSVAERSRAHSDVALDAEGGLHVVFGYKYPAGDREVRYGWLAPTP